jgi:hypothetical protein
VSIEQNVSFVPPDVSTQDDILDEGESRQTVTRNNVPNNVQNVIPSVPNSPDPQTPPQVPKTPPQTVQPVPVPDRLRITRTRSPVGYCKALNNGERTSVATIEEIRDEEQPLTNHWALAAAEREPTLKEALNKPDTKEWQEAVDYKINQLEKLKTWEIVDTPQGANVIPCHFVLATKCGPDGEKVKL